MHYRHKKYFLVNKNSNNENKIICSSKNTLSLAILCSIISCTKGGNGNLAAAQQSVYRFLPEGLEYVQLKEGIYLIYKDSASGLEDSVIVKTSSLKTIHFTSGFLNTDDELLALILNNADSTNREWFNGLANSTPITFYGFSIILT